MGSEPSGLTNTGGNELFRKNIYVSLFPTPSSPLPYSHLKPPTHANDVVDEPLSRTAKTATSIFQSGSPILSGSKITGLAGDMDTRIKLLGLFCYNLTTHDTTLLANSAFCLCLQLVTCSTVEILSASNLTKTPRL